MHGRGDRAVSAGQLEHVLPGTGFVEQGRDDRGDVGAGRETPTSVRTRSRRTWPRLPSSSAAIRRRPAAPCR
jgi:hypothetical protein